MLIDLHAHVIPGVDDGPGTTAASLALLAGMAAQGVTTVVAAAHAFHPLYNVGPDLMMRQTALLQAAASRAGIGICLLPSLEYTLGLELVLAARRGDLLPIGPSRAVVVELPGGDLPYFVERALHELLRAGYVPILNHPERSPVFQSDPERFWRLAEGGVLAMATAASLLGDMGKQAAALARALIRRGQERVFLVSDAHDLNRRPPRLGDALTLARELGKPDQSGEWSLIREEGSLCTTRESD